MRRKIKQGRIESILGTNLGKDASEGDIWGKKNT